MSKNNQPIDKAVELKNKFGELAVDVAKEVRELTMYLNGNGDFPKIDSYWKEVILILTEV